MTLAGARRWSLALSLAMLVSLAPGLGGRMSAPASVSQPTAKGNGLIAFVRYAVVHVGRRAVRGENSIYLVRPDGSGLKLLAEGVYAYARPAWSPDGTSLAYSVWRSSQVSRQRLNLDSVAATGKSPRWLTADSGHDYDPAWSPDGSELVFTSDRSDPAGDLWLMRADGSEQHKLFGTRGVQESQARWSPDGRRIVFTRSYGLGQTSIAVADADGKNVSPLRLGAGGFDPDWSPDGKLIAFARRTGGSSDIYVMGIDGGGLRAVTSGRDDEAPGWSPDGRQIVFERHGKGTSSSIYIVNRDGSGLRRLTRGAQDRAPAWAARVA